MNFDLQIVAQANAFVNALRSGQRARVPALKLEYWQAGDRGLRWPRPRVM
ncbi:succinate dehydrogenase flavoprotein subunit [Klebsiella pneumoniae]|nr:succinate dehydrogenase flavoprotein subunit [Klebsiella pneumoniae]